MATVSMYDINNFIEDTCRTITKGRDNMTPMKFWMVWRSDTPTTRYRHTTLSEACDEARRIARLEPGSKVYVLEAMEYYTTNDLTNVKL